MRSDLEDGSEIDTASSSSGPIQTLTTDLRI